MKRFWIKWSNLLKQTSIEFVADNAIKLSASLSYYAIFSLPPLLIVIIAITSLFFGHNAVNGELYWQIKGWVGDDTAMRLQEMLKNVKLSDNSLLATIIGVVVLLVGASGIFSEIQGSINYIWGIQTKPKRGLANFFKNWLMSFVMIGSAGILLMIGLILNTVIEILNKNLIDMYPKMNVLLFYLLNVITVFLMITALFILIFKTLPNGRISMKGCIIGALLSSLLFMISKFIIGAYLYNSHIASPYGAAGSVILLLVWVYYSSVVLYFGAEFTKVYARIHGQGITPDDYSINTSKSSQPT